MDSEREATPSGEERFEKKTVHIPVWHAPLSDEEEDEEDVFSVEAAWEMLLSLRSCQQVMVNSKSQKFLHIQVGVNVSQEFPWKQVRFLDLRDTVFDDIENCSILYDAFQGFEPDHKVLVGYAPILTQNTEEKYEGDPFIMYSNPDDARTALSIIRNIEAYERWKLHKRLVKRPRRWVSLKSEDEVDLTIQQRYADSINVEIQSVYPTTIPANKNFEYRRADDVRDGYVELIPGETKFDMVSKRRVHLAIMAGRARVNLEQQTDPTFPTNAAAQYLYEIKEDDEGLDTSDVELDEEEKKRLSEEKKRLSAEKKRQSGKPATPVPEEKKVKPPPEVSDQIKLLLQTLEFNQIDMYRNDYTLISDQEVVHYTNPYLEETLCFANISKSYQRFVAASDWYPTIAGLIVTAYTFTTPATIDLISQRVDTVQRAVLQPNPILMWSFSDNLNYKLDFESPLEITALSFCPYIPNLLFGGAKNGQLVLWDLQSRAENLDHHEILTAAQNRYRLMIADFLKWTIPINEDSTIPPATITGLEVSQKAAITGIYWMSKHYYVNAYGKVYHDPDAKAKNKFFITSALDGTLAFWNLDAAGEKKVLGGSGSAKDQPKALTQNESYFKGKVFKPIFTIAFNEPITAAICDTAVFSCVVKESGKKRNQLNFRTELVARDPDSMRQSVIISSFYGRIERLDWLGLYADADGRETVNKASADFSRVHDGPIIALKKNPFLTNIFAAIGRNILSVWKEDYNYSPIFWRKRPCDLTAVAWSVDRPAVLFITRIDGCLEAWDILARDDDACLSDILGGGIITAISEHRPSVPEKLLGIGDYNSSFRMVKLPHSFYIQIPNELQKITNYIENEESRKKAIQSWEQTYYENNCDVIEAKRQAELDSRKEMERIEKESALKAAKKAIEEAEQKQRAMQQPTHLTYTEKMRRKWDELNLSRLMDILMSRKRVNTKQLERETALEKRRLSYEAAKRESLTQTLQRVSEEVSAIRARILPAEKPDLLRQDMIDSAVTHLMSNVEDFEEIELEANDIIDGFLDFDDIDYIQFLHRGEQRRKVLNVSLGGNTERWFWYDTMKDDNLLSECNWGYEQFLSANEQPGANRLNSVVTGFDDDIPSDEIIPEYEE